MPPLIAAALPLRAIADDARMLRAMPPLLIADYAVCALRCYATRHCRCATRAMPLMLPPYADARHMPLMLMYFLLPIAAAAMLLSHYAPRHMPYAAIRRHVATPPLIIRSEAIRMRYDVALPPLIIAIDAAIADIAQSDATLYTSVVYAHMRRQRLAMLQQRDSALCASAMLRHI